MLLVDQKLFQIDLEGNSRASSCQTLPVCVITMLYCSYKIRVLFVRCHLRSVLLVHIMVTIIQVLRNRFLYTPARRTNLVLTIDV